MAQVPSNLIPTRITQLPTAPVASENSILIVVYNGNTYQIRAGDLLQVAGVPTTRQVIAGTSLTGGGQLSSDVTLSVAPGGIGSAQLANTGVTPGVYGTATQIPVFTVDSKGRVTAATTISVQPPTDYVPNTRQVIAGTGLNGGGALNANVTLNANLSNALPLEGDKTGVAGVSNNISRADHKHPAVDLSDDDQVDNILGLENGGTARSLVMNPGAMIWSGADGLYVGDAGTYGQVLVSGGTNAPLWANIATDAPQPAHYVYIGPSSGPNAPPTYRLLVSDDIPAALNNKALTNSTINSTTIGGTSAAAITGTTITANTQFDGPGTGLTGTAAGLSIGGNATTSTTANNLAGGAANRIAYQTGAGATSFITAPTIANTFLEWSGTALQWSVNPLGTVTSVGLALPAEFTISNSPVTTTGTLTGAWANQTANYIFAGPTTGSATTPAFRALVNADIPATLTGKTYNALTLTSLSTGWKISGGTTPVEVSFVGGSAYTISGTNGTTITLPSTSGTLALNNQQFYIGTTQVAINRSSASLALTGVSIDGSAGSVANSVTFDSSGTGGASPQTFNGSSAVTISRNTLGAAASGANADIISMSGVTGGISSPDFVQFDAAATVTDATAKLYYDKNDQYTTLSFQMNGSTIQKIGEEQYYRVKCSAAVTKGQVVMFSGTLGASGGLTAAPATGLAATQADYLLGVAVETGNTNDWIFVISFGEIKGINTTGGAENWVQGQVLYYDPSVTGGLTKTKPTTPNAIAIMAAVVHVGVSNGILFVRPSFGSVLGGTDGNVEFSSLANGDVIVYDGTDQRWENRTQSTLTVGTATNATNIAITNDTTTNATMYPVWVTANTGNLPAKVTSTKLSFNPSTGALTATGGIGGGTF